MGSREQGCWLGIALVLLACTTGQGWAAELSSEAACPATKAYLEQNTSSQAGVSSEDYHCLITAADIAASIDQYQLVDIRPSQKPFIKNSLAITASILKTKHYLRQKPLLLVSDGFSRVRSARLCAELASAGFQNTKILVDGVGALSRIQPDRVHGSLDDNVAKAQDLVFELAKGEVLVIAATPATGESLAKLNIATASSTASAWELAQQSQQGFLPVVWVAEGDSPPPIDYVSMTNFYQLDGGLQHLSQFFVDHEWANRRRTGVPNRYICPGW